MSNSRRALLTFAFVSEALKTHQDIFVGLAPLFHPIATSLSGELFSPEKLVGELSERYGLSITADVADFVSYSLHKAGLLKRKDIGSNDISFFWNSPPHTFRNSQSSFEENIEQIGAAAAEFAKANPSLLNWNLDQEKALDTVFDWIIDQDTELKYAEQIYGGNDQTTTLATMRLRTEEQYFCSRFIGWLSKTNPELYGVLSEVGNAVLVSEVIMELRQPTVSPTKPGSLYIYLDAPLCMELLNCSGTARKDDAQYIVERLKSFGAIVCVFSHSVEELRINLRAVLTKAPLERKGPTAAALIAGEIPEEFLWSVLKSPETHLDDAGISIFDVERTPLPLNAIQHFPDQYQTEVLSKLQPYYNRLEAAERDALSATIVMRRRARHSSSDLFRSKHTMITRNPMVSAVTRKFCKDRQLLQENQLGPIVQSKQAAAIIWLAAGSEQKKELSRRQLVLNCSKAIESAPDVIQQFRKKLRELKPENIGAFDALIREPRNLQIAMDFARGSEERALESDPEALLQKMTESLTEESKKRHTSEMTKLRREHKQQLRDMKTAIGQLTTDRDRHKEEQIEDLISHFSKMSNTCRRSIGFLKLCFAAVVFILGTVTSSVFLDKIDRAWIEGWTIPFSILAGLLVAVPVFRDPVQLIENFVRNRFVKKFTMQVQVRRLNHAAAQVELDWVNCRASRRPDKNLLV